MYLPDPPPPPLGQTAERNPVHGGIGLIDLVEHTFSTFVHLTALLAVLNKIKENPTLFASAKPIFKAN